MNSTWSVLTGPYLVVTVEPSTIGSRSRCTPSRETSAPWRSRLAAILSISSMNTMPAFSARRTASRVAASWSISLSTSCSVSARQACWTLSFWRLVLRPSAPNMSLSPDSALSSIPGWPPIAPGDATREKLRAMLRDGKLDDREVEVEITDEGNPLISVLGGQPGIDESALSGLKDMFGALGRKTKRQKMKVPQAWRTLTEQEVDKLIDHDAATREAVRRAENAGIVFIDEIDKIAASRDRHGADVSREGVQRDLLPIVEGSTVTTKYGPVRTDHVLFIAAGAFHMSKPSDLIPEMQGRFPIRVELTPLVAEDFVRILTEPRNALTRQYAALLATEGVTIEWADDAIRELAKIAADVNRTTHDIGARRLHTVLERLLDDLLYNAPDIGTQTIPITPAYVRERLGALVADEDLARYIL